ncbi:hypothetical protein E2P81_ATG01756 [Venturia nashicola]|nr:hypothetical protein E2P81_ATG01756 [Venturia nashicola]
MSDPRSGQGNWRMSSEGPQGGGNIGIFLNHEPPLLIPPKLLLTDLEFIYIITGVVSPAHQVLNNAPAHWVLNEDRKSLSENGRAMLLGQEGDVIQHSTSPFRGQKLSHQRQKSVVKSTFQTFAGSMVIAKWYKHREKKSKISASVGPVMNAAQNASSWTEKHHSFGPKPDSENEVVRIAIPRPAGKSNWPTFVEKKSANTATCHVNYRSPYVNLYQRLPQKHGLK